MEKLSKIMLVEDDDNIREIATRTLTRLGGYEVVGCSSGQEALDKVLSAKPQLILLDVMMPGLDGISTLNRLKQMVDAKNIPVVFLTARVQPKQIEEYLKLGAVDVISEPFEPATLSKTLEVIWAKCGHQVVAVQVKPPPRSKALENLYASYAVELPQKISSIVDDWNQLQAQVWAESERNELYQKVHQLAGSSGTMGFKTCGEKAKAIELLLEALENKKPTPASIQEIDVLVKQLSALPQSPNFSPQRNV